MNWLYRTVLVSTCFSILAVVWFIGQLEKKNDCLNVDFFSEIGWEKSSIKVSTKTSDKTSVKTTYPICSKKNKNASTPFYLRDMVFLQKQLTSFEDTVLIFRDSLKPLSLIVVEEPSLKLKVDARKIIIGKRLLYTQGMLLKSLNSAWLLQKNPSLSYNPLMLEVMSDFLLAIESGGLSIKQPISGEIAKFTQNFRQSEARSQSEKHFCHNPWLPASQLLMCEAFLNLQRSKKYQETESRLKSLYQPFSYRSEIGNTFWEKYLSVGISERVSSLSHFFHWVKEENFKKLIFPENKEEILSLSSKYARSAFEKNQDSK